MKTAIFPSRGLRSQLLFGAMSLGIFTAGWMERAGAESVDTELLLLVDITQRGLNRTEFEKVMDDYATAMTSSEVLDSIQSGAYGRIAVSLMFYGNSVTQEVGVPWMSIGSASDAQQFADFVRQANPPFSIGTPAIDSALQAATLAFGSETGGAGNGFESLVQIIDLAGASSPTPGDVVDVAAARDSALASGVDMINAIALGNRATQIEGYYASNVIGGEAGGVLASTTTSGINASLGSTLAGQISGGVNGAAVESLASVPEPSPVIAILSGLSILLIRRRRN